MAHETPALDQMVAVAAVFLAAFIDSDFNHGTTPKVSCTSFLVIRACRGALYQYSPHDLQL